MQEKFSITEVSALRRNLLQPSLDSFQVAEIVKVFVAGRGYGISAEKARDIAYQLEAADDKVEFLHQHLESFALVM